MKKEFIKGIFGVIIAIITGTLGYKAGCESVEQRIENQVSQVVEVNNGDADAAVDYLVDRVEELEGIIETYEKQKTSSNTEIEDTNDVEIIEKEDQSINLLETDYFAQSEGSTFEGIVDVEGDKDNIGEVHSKGFVYDGDHYYMGYRTYSLNKKYESIRGTIALPFTSRDTTGKCTVRITDENDNQLYQSNEITSGVKPQEFEFDVSGVDEITFEFIATEGSIQVGVYDVMVNIQ